MDFTHGLDNISYFWTVKEGGDALGVVERGEGGKLVSLVYWIVLLNVVVMAVGGLVPLKSISTDVVTHSLTLLHCSSSESLKYYYLCVGDI